MVIYRRSKLFHNDRRVFGLGPHVANFAQGAALLPTLPTARIASYDLRRWYCLADENMSRIVKYVTSSWKFWSPGIECIERNVTRSSLCRMLTF